MSSVTQVCLLYPMMKYLSMYNHVYFTAIKKTIDPLCYCSTACIDCHLAEVMSVEDSDQTFTVSMLENFSQKQHNNIITTIEWVAICFYDKVTESDMHLIMLVSVN